MAGLLDFGMNPQMGGLLAQFNQPANPLSDALLSIGTGLLSGDNWGSGVGKGLQMMAQNRSAQQDQRLRQLMLMHTLQKDARDFKFQQSQADRTQANADRTFEATHAPRNQTIKALTDRGYSPEDAAAIATNPTLLAGVLGQSLGVATSQTDDMKELDLINRQRQAAGQPTMTMEQLFRVKKGADVEADVAQRAKLAEQQGLKPGSPAYQAFVLTGKMPREDQQPLSATDKKAIMEADEAVLAAQEGMRALTQAKELSKKAYEGPTASGRGYVTSLFGNEAGIATTDLNNTITTNALGQMKAIFGGNPTEGERKILLDIQGSASQPHAVREKIYDRAIALAERRLKLNKERADELRGGTFYKPQDAKSSASAPADPLGIR